jgi:hypothetical protein
MPLVPAAVAFAVDYAVVELGVAAAIKATVGSGIVAAATTGAVVGATTAAITGGDVGKGALMGGVGSAVGSQFQAAPKEVNAAGKAQYPKEFAKNIGGDITQAGVRQGLSREVAEGVTKGVGQFAAGTAAGVAGGENIGTAAERGLISAGTGVAKDILFPVNPNASKGEKYANIAERELFDVGASSLFSSNKGGVGATSFTQQAPQTSVATTGSGTSPGSEALAQALRLDPGAPVFGGEKEGGKKSGWNVESLRYMGNSEA